MENEIINNITEEVMENSEDIMNEVCIVDGTGKGIAIGVGLAGVGYGIYKLGRKLWSDFKAKRAAKVEVPEDITQDKIDEIPE